VSRAFLAPQAGRTDDNRVRGKLIVLEGIDGAGTTTQAARLGLEMAARDVPVHVTREPSDGPLGVEIRKILRGAAAPFDPTALALLFAADRMDHVARVIEPGLAHGVNVVSDRYLLSSWVYQGRFLDGEFVRAINARAPAADLTLLLDVSAEVGAARRHARGGGEELFDGLELQRALAARYLAAAEQARAAGGNVVILDGEKDADAVFAAVLAAVKNCLGGAAWASST
jgi:dTMP kinase